MSQLLSEAADAAEVAICAVGLHDPYFSYTFLGLKKIVLGG